MDKPFLRGDELDEKVGRRPQRMLACVGRSMLIGMLIAAVLATGCASQNVVPFMDQMVPFTDQRNAILEVVPLGTPRDEAAAQLKKAGITYTTSPGPDPGVYYCESWELEPGERYLLFSEMLFDGEGRLQEVRQTPNNYPQ